MMTGRPIAELIDRHAAALVLYARQWCAAPEDAVPQQTAHLESNRTVFLREMVGPQRFVRARQEQGTEDRVLGRLE